ncbi:hypothetical protein ACTJJ7_24240 [Phyllobacterium sp. 22229]|jgi:hypothetical protein|uniref:Uncharacterized protein n=1 Tax=Phyllobacterium myrsinacearum TaxID=28101 RepID=A0A2S9JAQ7_9HYPH|nr:hypothetical protein [Phyllobacterium myrsinacearum]PRD49868.1 hypothetical protein C5750_23875 [Phyllobacterium myrsinacearum]PWV83906.1 hypothetical protein DEV92_1197 [Phyllobacterium myrsinacearum]RZS76781.1 hypothetical protein EV217_5004 [Phyllobacterium myrsinacearum]RZU97025.1 hypothetical protein EV654_5017 [Phyllobacterium myrsinacearum]
MNLRLDAKIIEFVYDKFDTNAINFITDDSAFSVATGTYLEDDEDLNETEFMYNSERQYGGCSKIEFFSRRIVLTFQEKLLDNYEIVEIVCQTSISKEIINFFNNYLFVGDIVQYSAEIPEENRIQQSVSRELL